MTSKEFRKTILNHDGSRVRISIVGGDISFTRIEFDGTKKYLGAIGVDPSLFPIVAAAAKSAVDPRCEDLLKACP